MLIGYDNKNVASQVSAVTLVNISAAAQSHTDNLLYEDPKMRFVSGSPSGDPEIIFSYNVATSSQHFVSGVFNWKNMHHYDTLELYAGPSSSGPWTEFVTINLSPAIPATASPSLIIRHAGVAAQHWRWLFNASPAANALDIGNLCSFRGYEVDMNPDTGGIRRSYARPPLTRRAPGGALHRARHISSPDESLQLLWSRLDDTTFAKLYDIDTVYPDRFVAVIPPNQVGRELPLGLPHFLGRSRGFEATALQGPSATEHAQRTVWNLEGAI